MKIGKITSLVGDPKRDTEVRISSTELFSAVSEPPGSIVPSEVVGLDVIGERRWFRSPVYRCYVRLTDERHVLFYATEEEFDAALLADEFLASYRHVAYTWKKA
jgi:hypothetical protein